MTKDELKPIDTSKYNITETGQVLKMTKEELEKENAELKAFRRDCIKLTDKEMAEKYRKALKQKLIDEDNFERLEMFDENVQEAYLAGLKAGKLQEKLNIRG